MRPAIRPLLSAFFLLLSLAGTSTAGDEPPVWRPVTAYEMQLKAPTVESDADAEGIFWEVWLDDEKTNSIYQEHYIRVKIFTARGQERFSKFDIPFTKGLKIDGIAARVIRPDGTILTLDPKDIFEREIVKANKVKVTAKSFAVPGIEPGVIVEYKYRETFKDTWGNGINLEFQHDIPVQKIAYHIRPQPGYRLVTNFFNMPETAFVEDPAQKGFLIATQSNVPAYKTEPNMPPENEVRRWAFVGYTIRDERIWINFYRRYSYWLTRLARPTDQIKRKAAELTNGASSEEEKLRRIYEYVQRQIKNVDFDRPPTEGEIDDVDDQDHAEDVIKRGMGRSRNIELLFASLAMAAGFEVNLAFTGNRSIAFFSPEKYPFSSFIRMAGVAVRVGGEMKYFNASVPFLAYGQLLWQEQGVSAMLIGPGSYSWRATPVPGPESSPARRIAIASISEDGTLEGTIKLEYSGQQAIWRRSELFSLSDQQRKERVEQELKERVSTAELSEIVIENLGDASKPLTFGYKLKIPNYAQRTGQRLILQPGIFEYGAKPFFATATRTHGIHFSYPWSENDEIELKLPDGFTPENVIQPAPIADTGNITSLRVSMSINSAANVLGYKREFHFGGDGKIFFPQTAYPALKRLFDSFHRTDSRVVTLKGKK
jgi:hypothetical protein